MNKVYFDQNVWQEIVENICVNDFESDLKRSHINICIGLDNIIEFARCFLDEEKKEIIEYGRKVFKYLYELSDIFLFLKQRGKLIDSDIEYARTGGRCLPYLGQLNIVSEKQELFRLSQGQYNAAKNFLEGSEKNLRDDRKIYKQLVLGKNKGIRPPQKFDILKDDWSYRRKILEESPYGNSASYLKDEKLFSNPKNYPYLNTYINAQLYVFFITLSKPDAPSIKVFDYLHLINANAADWFVTRDKSLQGRFKKICPHITTLTFKEFCAKLIPMS